eukprot:Nk52_evm23s1444 gene=Nk52_evmTU23s1444
MLSSEEFVWSHFGPVVVTFTTQECDRICGKNNLKLCDLLQPFGVVNKAQAEDTTGVPYIINNLTMRFVEMPDLQGATPKDAEKILNYAVSKDVDFPEDYLKIVGREDVPNYLRESKVADLTPWYRNYCHTFIHILKYSEHESINHPVAALIAVSSGEEDPVKTASSMYDEENPPMIMSKPWLDPNLLKYYVMVNDVSEVSPEASQEKFSVFSQTFGENRCFLLNINTRAANSDIPPLPDMWTAHLRVQKVASSAESPPGLRVAGRLSAEGAEISTPGTPVEDRKVNDSEGHPLKSSSSQRNSLENSNIVLPCGEYLADGDVANVNNLISAFTHEALVPHMTEVIQDLNENVASTRRGISRSLFSATKKWFGSSKQPQSNVQQQHGGYGPNGYRYQCAEAQMRKLGDYAFMLQDYSLAFMVFQSVKRDYHNDRAYKYVAGAQEMSGLSLFMKDATNNSDADQYFESAISLYSTKCANFALATRSTILLTELYRCRGQLREAASVFIRMTGEESDLRSALLLEQAAHCFLSMKPSMHRKYVFHLILAGHRYSKAGQRYHALRCYLQSLCLYEHKNWALAEDHIHFTVGRQSYSVGKVQEALRYFERLLRKSSQYPQQESSYFGQYVHALKHALARGSDSPKTSIPELPIPLLDNTHLKVTLASHFSNTPSSLSDDTWMAMEKRGVGYVPEKVRKENWMDKHKEGYKAKALSVSPMFKAAMTCYSSETDNSSGPITCVDETVWVDFLISNPLQIVLQLYNVSLCCFFKPKGSEEIIEDVSNIINLSCTEKIILEGREEKYFKFSALPKTEGTLFVKGLTYSLAGVIQGKKTIELKGKRLNKTRQQRKAVMYGPDKRLEISVASRMPLLRMEVTNFPEYLLSGEVKKSIFNFTNKGASSLMNLKVVTNNSENLVFGSMSELNEDFMPVQGERTSNMECPFDITECREYGKGIYDINLGRLKLEPGESISIPVWVKGGNVGTEELNMLFCYESDAPTKLLPYRCLRYTVNVKVLGSIKVTGFTKRSVSDGSSFILGMEVENLQGSAQFKGKQLTMFSKKWKIEQLSGWGEDGDSCLVLEPREVTSLFFKVIKSPFSAGENEVFVFTCPFGPEVHDCTRKSTGNLLYSSLKRHDEDSKDANEYESILENGFEELEIGVCMLWEVNNKPHKGFHSLPVMDLVGKFPSSLEIPKTLGHQLGLLQLNTSDSNIYFSLDHMDNYEHDFGASRKCEISLSLLLKNYFQETVVIVVDLLPQNSRLSVGSLSAGDNFVWTGKTKLSCKIPANCSEKLKVSIALFSPGVYDVNRYVVRVFKETSPLHAGEEISVLKSPNQNLVAVLAC